MRSWKKSASESIFTVELPALDTQQSTPSLPNTRSVPPRNRRPCGRCSDKQKKCDISPPYSRTRCAACTKANIPFCPPHKPRRFASTRRSSRLSYSSEQPLPSGSRPIASQGQLSGTAAASGLTKQNLTVEKEAETQFRAQSFEEGGLGLDYTDVLTTSQALVPVNNPVFSDFERVAFEGLGGLDPGLFLAPPKAFFAQTSQSEEMTNNAQYVFSETYVPAFLPSL